ncbi:diacylglycerol kinase eta-like [Schistocerca serialis cubense]|uniref:diacylglycerol kinase eta-like n=1 Tax=Schistocerca serialis cubense TaxID=2023355 RepID=UPI00214E8BB1|nr:diacylglycerol kinase eta-like [Schistocerca serialis cubense]
MASGGRRGVCATQRVGQEQTGEESSESDGETEPAKSFHRRLSTNKEIKSSAATKEGFLMKQTWSFQRWRRRYFKLKGRKLYYAKDTKICTCVVTTAVSKRRGKVLSPKAHTLKNLFLSASE